MKWVKSVVIKLLRRKYLNRNHHDIENLIGEGYLAYLEASKNFDSSLGTLRRFARFRIEGAVLDKFRKIIGNERNAHKNPVVCTYAFEKSDEKDVETDLIQKIDFNRSIRRSVRNLRQLQLLESFLQGRTQQEIADQFHISYSRVFQLLHEVKGKLIHDSTEFLSSRLSATDTEPS